ncbi:MAG: N-acetylmuramoyl-L-alanine amidase-like domain-containing protein [Bacteroidota bacterium]
MSNHSKAASSRREFLKTAILLTAGSVAFRPRSFAKPHVSDDEWIVAAKFALARKEALAQRPIGEVMAAIGASFIGTPYAANTLELPGDERLVVNLHGLDCVTFVENTLALSRCVKSGKTDFGTFNDQLRLIRYRDGVLDGYASRLHYFSEWIQNNGKKDIVKDVAREIGVEEYTKKITFMSSHRESYKQLKDDAVYESIREIEDALNTQTRYLIPKDKVESLEAGFNSGDIIAITTTIDGLDVSHTGLAYRENGILKYLHAPLSGGAVQISGNPLWEYLARNKKATGVMVARPLEP